MLELKSEFLVDGFLFPQSPRWWDGQLWFTDVFGKAVMKVNGDGTGLSQVVSIEGLCGGFGRLPDGSLVIAEQDSKKLWRQPAAGEPTELHTDLSPIARYWLNDLMTTPDGCIYTGLIGHDVMSGEQPAPGWLALTTPSGESRIVADDLTVANGIALSEDGNTLFVAQGHGAEITAFDREDDGSLTGRRVFASLPGKYPATISLDVEGAIWCGSYLTHEFLRVEEGGRITHRISADERWAFGPVLGGPERRTLYLLSADTDLERLGRGDVAGRIDALEVDVPGVGSPQ